MWCLEPVNSGVHRKTLPIDLTQEGGKSEQIYQKDTLSAALVMTLECFLLISSLDV